MQNGLALIPDDAEGVVGVHDGVRPFPSIDVIHRCYDTAHTTKAVIPVIPVVETLRHIYSSGQQQTNTDSPKEFSLRECGVAIAVAHCYNNSVTVPRYEYRLVQTPQCFDIQLLKAADKQPYNDGFTDDASVVESYGHAITLVEGNRENIKITTPYDLKIAEVLVQ